MAGISEYRRAAGAGVGGYYHGFYEQGDHPQVASEHQIHGTSGVGRASSSRGDYTHDYGGGSGSRAISPFSVGSPRFGVGVVGYPAYVIDGTEDSNMQTLASKGAGLVAIVVENLLSHPFLVVKRQCQVHVTSRRYHVFPFTLINPMFQICQRQGVAVLWKGLGSTLVVRGMALAVEDVGSKITSCPKEISRHSTTKAVMQHLLLKAVSAALITPFYSASLVETVQSDVASEAAGFFDIFKEGFWRLIAWPSTGRLVPLTILVVPTVAHSLLSYLIYTGVKSVSISSIKRARESKERKSGALSKDGCVSYYTELIASLVGNMVADLILFPLETVLNRLHLQGTRTIIDSLENGVEVTPILTSYAGVMDCIRTTVEEEGMSGLYKGFGALILQYGVQILIIRTMKVVLENNPFGIGGSGGGGTTSSNHSDRSTPPLVVGGLNGDRAALTSTPPVHHSRSEPADIAGGRNLYDFQSRHGRRTPPTTMNISRDPYAAPFDPNADGQEIRRRSRLTNYSPTTGNSGIR